jgi:hypothetical protein
MTRKMLQNVRVEPDIVPRVGQPSDTAPHLQEPADGGGSALGLAGGGGSSTKTKTLVPAWQDTKYGKLSKGLFWEANSAWKKHRHFAEFWAVWYYGLGIAAVVLAALAGFGGLSKLLGYLAAALIALGSGIATGLVVFLRSDEKRRQHDELATAWDNLRDNVTTLYETRPVKAGAEQTDPDGWQAVWDALLKRAESLRRGTATSDPPAAWPPATE